MKSFRIETPQFQNWSCHGCSECCRGQHLVRITTQEKRRIEAQGWTEADGVIPATMIIEERGGLLRLGHQSDGSCAFLDATGRCRIHARFGEAAKPLACRIFPLAIHPAGDKLVVSLRFSCPSAVANRGLPLSEQSDDIQRKAELIVPKGFKSIPPPPVLHTAGLGWPDFMRFVMWLDATMAAKDAPVALKIVRALYWLRAVERARFDQVTGPEANEILEALARSAAEKIPAMPETSAIPSRFGRFFFRTLVFQYARRDTAADLAAGGLHRWTMLMAALPFAIGSGHLPPLQPCFKPVELSTVERPFGRLPGEAEATLTRFFRVKIRGLHFCGRAFYGLPLIEGFRSLALLYPVIIWLARWLAAGEQRTSLSPTDVARAIATADHQHGYSPLLGSFGFRWRVRLLAQRDDIVKLCWWCSQ
jgi:lysine-N-methylase